ncbi:MAG: hypothetical protein ABIR33_17385 [Pyrinomonadaceae bacterium]
MKLILWTVIVAVSWNTFAQDAVRPETKRFGSFNHPSAWAESDKRTNEFLSEYFDTANRYKNSIGLVILRGSFDDIVNRRLQVDRAAYSLKFESIRLRFRVVKSDTDASTEVWVMPANAIVPSVDSESWIGLTPKEGVEREIWKELRDFFDRAFHLRGEIRYYIINMVRLHSIPDENACLETSFLEHLNFPIRVLRLSMEDLVGPIRRTFG